MPWNGCARRAVPHEGRPLCARLYARSGTRESATGAPAVCRGPRLDGSEYVDHGISGAKDRRPALDELVRDAKRRRFDVLVCWRLDRLGRNLKHLITLLEELQALGVAFVSLAEGIDATTPAGKLQMHILGAIAEFERARLRNGRSRACASAVPRKALGPSPSQISARRPGPRV